MEQAILKDQRRHQRYPIKGEVLIGTRPFYHTVGCLKDISEGGAGFEYPSSGGNGQSRAVEVEIVCGKYLRLSRVPCRVVYDSRVDEPSSGDSDVRRCGLEFGRLSYQQADLLSLILKSCS